MNKSCTLLILVLFSFFSCHRDEPQAPKECAHTLLIYMLAENNLYQNSEDDFKEIVAGMKHAPTSFGVYVYLDDYNVPRLYQITSSGAKLIKSYSELNSASTLQLRTVLNQVKEKSPSQSYGLILWSHGYDWLPSPTGSRYTTSVASDIKPRFFGQDGNNWMDISDIDAALSPNELLYIAFDACYMSSIEIAYRLKAKTQYLMVSPMEVLNEGFPYQLILPALYSNSINVYTERVLTDASRTYFEYYRDHQDDTKRYGAISLIRTSGLEQLAEACQPILSIRTANMTDGILQGTQFYERQHAPSLIYDLYAYLSKLASPEELTGVQAALDSCIVYKNTTSYLPYSFTRVTVYSGFGCYIPAPMMTYNVQYAQEPWYLRTYLPR